MDLKCKPGMVGGGAEKDIAEAPFEHKPEGSRKVRMPEKELPRRREEQVQRPWDKNMPGT